MAHLLRAHCYLVGTPSDWVLLGFAAAATIPFVLGNVVVFRHRRRKFFQGACFILTSSFAGLMWIISSFVVNGHFPRKGPILRNCTLWTFWLQGTFGFSLWFSCIILRLHMLNSTRGSTWKYGFYVTASWLLVIALSVLATEDKAFKKEHKLCGWCKLKTKWKVSTWSIMVAPYLIGVCFLLLQLRRIKHRNEVLIAEYRHTCEYVAMASVIMVLSWITFLTKGEKVISGRCFLTFCGCCLVFFHFWVRLGWPVYLCIFKSKEEVDRYEGEVYRSCSVDTLGAIYSQRPAFLPSSEGAALEALTTAAEELEKYKAEIRELESKKAALQARLDERTKLRVEVSDESQTERM